MSDSFVNPIFGERDEPAPVVETEGPAHTDSSAGSSTGSVDVDAVIASLDGLDDAPVAAHVAVFEQAHESLRRALADAGESSVRG